jgi:Ras-related protein Rab-5C
LQYFDSAKATSHKGSMLLTQVKAIRPGVGGTAHSFAIDHHAAGDEPGGSVGGSGEGGGGSSPELFSLICQAASDEARDQWVAALRLCCERTHKCKLVLLGESGAGKSSIVQQFCYQKFEINTASTIGASFQAQTVVLDEFTLIKFDIWDTAGQERYNSLAPMYYREAAAAVVVFDLTSLASFAKAKAWIDELKQQAKKEVQIGLAANKLDLAGQHRQVATEEAEHFANQHGLVYLETSAKTGHNVNQLFHLLATRIPLHTAGGGGGGGGGARVLLGDGGAESGSGGGCCGS